MDTSAQEALAPTKGLSKAACTLEMERRQGTAQEGYITLEYKGEQFRTWYQSIGYSPRNPSRPLVVIHGGPGLTSRYLSTLAGLHATRSIPVIFYDQQGCGRSYFPSLSDKPQSFWSLELFLAELDNVLRYLGIRDSAEKGFDLFGHGFGGVIAAEYASSVGPRGLKKLVLSSTPASSELWVQSRIRALDELPPDISDILKVLEKVAQIQSDEYQRMITHYLRKYVCTLDPWPQHLTESMVSATKSPTVVHSLFVLLSISTSLQHCSFVSQTRPELL